MCDYNEAYFTSGNYEDYMQKYDRYLKMVTEIDDLFSRVCLRDRTQLVLDFGCAVGHVVRAHRDLGYTRVIGYDISQWAVDKGNLLIRDEVLYTNQSVLSSRAHVTFMLDVLEHMTDEDVNHCISWLRTEYIIIRMPVTDTYGGELLLPSSRRDKTHINVKTKSGWLKVFSDYGYEPLFKLNLFSIWDSDGVLAVVLKKV